MTDPRMTPTNDAPVTVEEAATDAAFRAINGPHADPFTSPESWDFAATVADAVRHRLAALASAPACAASPDHADIMETIANAGDDWQKRGYPTALAEVRDMANVGRSLLERIADHSSEGPLKGWHPADCPTEVVCDLLNMLADASAPAAISVAIGGAVCVDCGIPYGDDAWIEAVVSHDDWKRIDPSITAILCPNCMGKRAAKLGIQIAVEAMVGPLFMRNPVAIGEPASAPAGDGEPFTGVEAWDELVNVDDRTSPEEYPDMCLITRDELIDFMRRASAPAGSVTAAVRGITDDYMTSEAHHPGYVLIPTARFEMLREAETLLASAPAWDGVEDCDALAERLCAARFPTTVARHPDYYRVQLTEESRERWRVVADAALARPRAAVGEREAGRVAGLEEAALIAQTYGVPGGYVADAARGVAKAIRERLALQSPPAKVEG